MVGRLLLVGAAAAIAIAGACSSGNGATSTSGGGGASASSSHASTSAGGATASASSHASSTSSSSSSGSSVGGSGGTGSGGSGGALVCGLGTENCGGTCLADTMNGACGCAKAMCSLSELCAQDACMPSLATASIAAPTTDDKALYWLDSNQLVRLADASNMVEMLGAYPGPAGDPVLAIDDTYVYTQFASAGGTSVGRWPKAGGAFQPLGSDMEGSLGLNNRSGVGVDATYVYWDSANGVYRAPLAGGPSELWVFLGCVTRFVVGGGTAFFGCSYSNVIWTWPTSKPPLLDPSKLGKVGGLYDGDDIQVANGFVVWSYQHKLYRAPVGGGMVEAFAPPMTTLDDFKTDGPRVYTLGKLSDGATGVLRFDAFGAPSFKLIVENDGFLSLSAFGATSSQFYFGQENFSLSVYRAPK